MAEGGDQDPINYYNNYSLNFLWENYLIGDREELIKIVKKFEEDVIPFSKVYFHQAIWNEERSESNSLVSMDRPPNDEFIRGVDLHAVRQSVQDRYKNPCCPNVFHTFPRPYLSNVLDTMPLNFFNSPHTVNKRFTLPVFLPYFANEVIYHDFMLPTDWNPGPFYIIDNSFVSKRKYPWLYCTFDLYYFCRAQDDITMNFYNNWIEYDKIQTSSAYRRLFDVRIDHYPEDKFVMLKNPSELNINIKLFDSAWLLMDASKIFICDHGCGALDTWREYLIEHPDCTCLFFIYSYETCNFLVNRMKMLRMFYNKLNQYNLIDCLYDLSNDLDPLIVCTCACGSLIEPILCDNTED